MDSERKETIYSHYNIIDLDFFKEIKKELLRNTNVYYPVLIRRLLGIDYHTHLTDTRVYDKIYETRNYTSEDEVNELLDWVKQNNRYENLLNKKEYNKIIKDLKEFGGKK